MLIECSEVIVMRVLSYTGEVLTGYLIYAPWRFQLQSLCLVKNFPCILFHTKNQEDALWVVVVLACD